MNKIWFEKKKKKLEFCMHKNWLQKDVECLKVDEKPLICENSHSDERKNNQQDIHNRWFHDLDF